MTGRPAAFSALAFASTARVADSEIADTRVDILVIGMRLSCHLHADDLQPVAGAPGLSAARTGHLSVWFDERTASDVHSGDCKPEGSSSIGRVPVSKTGGWGFESLLPCQCGPAGPARSGRLARVIRTVLHR